ncbi:MAG: hypothetical protein UX94_C0013G0018 [Parcubacteria group bacterium GW2011_GWA2_47_21]|nr:MAG: hypothetical protein UX94_C0013G0018 [Parcubacteria group bacterium GW2011_GWA2_47_21]
MWVGLSDRETGNEVSRLQKFLRAQGDFTYSEITGFYGPATEEAVRRFQSRSGIVSGGNAETTGYGIVGPSTRAKIAEISCGDIYPLPTPKPFPVPIPPANNLPPVIDGVSGPTTLNVGETGTWSVKAHDPESGLLSYIVNWGDSVSSGSGGTVGTAPLSISASQTTTFTHSYSTAGTYKVVFTVTDNNGLKAESSISVQVGNTTELSVTYPKGGENMVAGDPMLIRWTPVVSISVLEIVSTAGNYSFGIYGPKYGNTIPITTGEYTYIVVNTTPAGSYYVRITPTDGSAQAISKTFTINTINQPSITVLSPNGGETWALGQSQTIRWKSNSLAGNVGIYLSYSGGIGGICKIGSAPVSYGSFTFTPTSNTPCSGISQLVPGQYKVRLIADGQSLTSDLGIYDESNSYFKIYSDSTQPSITVLSPNGGENYVLGRDSISIRWSPVLPGVSTIQLVSSKGDRFQLYGQKVSGDPTNVNGYYTYQLPNNLSTIYPDTYQVNLVPADGKPEVRSNKFSIFITHFHRSSIK